MDRKDNIYVMSDGSHDTGRDGLSLGRLGAELARIYDDTLAARLPSNLQSLVDRLDDALRTAGHGEFKR